MRVYLSVDGESARACVRAIPVCVMPTPEMLALSVCGAGCTCMPVYVLFTTTLSTHRSSSSP